MKGYQKKTAHRFLGAAILAFLILTLGVQSTTFAFTDRPSMEQIGPPSAPSWIFATDGKYQNRVTINWPDVSSADSYDVIRSTSATVYGSMIGSSTNSFFSDTTAKPGQTYYYRVRACNMVDCSGYSNNNSGFVAHDSIGLYQTSNGYFRLRLSNSPGPTDIGFRFGPLGSIPIMGDWNGDGLDTPGVYDPTNGYFRLRNSNSPGPPNYAFQFGPANWTPIAGDWNGDGIDTIGVYNRNNGAFRLRNSNSAGATDILFIFGDPYREPIVGDWNGDGIDTIGVYDGCTSYFQLRNANSGGPAHDAFKFGLSGSDPIVGDWDMDGKDTIGVYYPSNSYFRLRNTNSAGTADIQFQYGPLIWSVLSGDWDNQ